MPTVLVRLACDIARYHLYDDRATEQVAKRYNDAIKFLALVSKGDVQLGVSADEGAPAASAGGPESCNPGRSLTSDTLRDFTA